MPRSTVALALSLASSLALGAAVTGCSDAGKRETRTLADAVDRYWRADDAAKPAEAKNVAGVPCTDAKVCDAKQICVAAIDPTARAYALKDEVARRLVDIEQKRLAPDSAEAAALPGKLDEATKLLGEGRAKMADCERKIAELRALHGV